MEKMELRKTRVSDINEIMKIIKEAQNQFKAQGIDQWQNNYPNKEVIKNDMKKKNSYVLIKGEKILGTVAIIFDGEETYKKIYQGKWISNDQYAVIHRMAIDFNLRGSGVASDFLARIESLCIDKGFNSIKVDTHRENIPMTKLLLKNHYKECGIIYLDDNSERIAFEKLLKSHRI